MIFRANDGKRVSLNKDLVIDIIIYLGILFTALIFCFHCLPNPFSSAEPNCDANVFRTVAYIMREGGMPYRDSFDHKGPILYFLNVLGQEISFYRGIWVVEFVNLFVTYALMYKIGRLYCSRILSYVILLICSVPMFGFMEGGDFVEEFAMPCIAAALLIFLDYFKNDRIDKVRLIVCGATCAYVFFLRPNMLSVWAICCIAVLIKCIFEKHIERIAGFLIYFFIGVLIVSLPIIIWILVNGIWNDFVFNYFTFNGKYSFGDGFYFGDKISSFIYHFSIPLVMISILFSFLMAKLDNAYTHLCVGCSLILSVALISLGGRIYGHYGFVLVPLLVEPLAFFASKVEERVQDKVILSGIVIVVTVIFAMPKWTELLQSIPEMYFVRNDIEEQRSDELIMTCNIVQDNTVEGDRISVFGNWDSVYLITQRLPSSKYSYQLPIGTIAPEIMDDYFRELDEMPPKMLVVEKRRYTDRIKEYTEAHSDIYEMIWASDPENLDESVVIFKYIGD